MAFKLESLLYTTQNYRMVEHRLNIECVFCLKIQSGLGQSENGSTFLSCNRIRLFTQRDVVVVTR